MIKNTHFLKWSWVWFTIHGGSSPMEKKKSLWHVLILYICWVLFLMSWILHWQQKYVPGPTGTIEELSK